MAILLCAPITASAVTLGFDELTAMGNVPGSAVPVAHRLSRRLLSAVGVQFGSGSDFVAVVVHAPDPTTSSPNVIGGVTESGALSYGTPIVITFFDPTDSEVPGVTDFVSVRGDKRPLPVASATLEAFDASGSLLDSVTAPDSAAGLTPSIEGPGIHSIRLTQSSAGLNVDGTIGFDDLTFHPVVAVPEPMPLSALLAGLVLLGLRGRGRSDG